MKKLKLNKVTVSVLDKKQMVGVKGGNAEIADFISIVSCRRSRRVTRGCCRLSSLCR